jgi:adenylate kinase family enzyme
MIIHINGCAGSGKSTLGRKIARNKKFTVIEADDIDDANAVKIIQDKKYDNLFTMKNVDKFFNLLKKKSEDSLDEVLDKVEKSGKIAVVIGLTINVPDADKKYFIKIGLDKLYKNIHNRTFNDICSHKKEIDKLLKTEKNIHKINMLLLYKYKIRQPVPSIPPEIEKQIKDREKQAKKDKFKIMTADNIYKEIMKL